MAGAQECTVAKGMISDSILPTAFSHPVGVYIIIFSAFQQCKGYCIYNSQSEGCCCRNCQRVWN